MAVGDDLAGFRPKKDTLLTVGVFDGVHLGHKHLIARLVQQAHDRDLLAGVITFRQHPVELLHPDVHLPLLTDLEERIHLLELEGVDFVVPLSFTRELASCTAQKFLYWLKSQLRMRGLVVGPDFALGKERAGDIQNLAKLGKDMDFTVAVVPPLTTGGEVISSTAIREALATGDLEKACRLAGRPFSLQGRVVTGAGRGAAMGFPTANLSMSPSKALPADGVYAGWAYLNGKALPSMTNIGTCPTFETCPRTVEVHIMDYRGDLYGRDIKVELLKKVREETRFGSVQDLKRQMAEDVKQGREILKKGCTDKK